MRKNRSLEILKNLKVLTHKGELVRIFNIADKVKFS